MINLLKSLPRYNETFGSIKSDKGLVYVKADFIFSVKNNIQIDGIDDWRQTRIGNERSAWVKLCEIAGTPGIQIKDLRKYWNSYLVNTCGLSHKEAGLHIGNSNMVNFIHYTQVEYEAISAKLESLATSEMWGDCEELKACLDECNESNFHGTNFRGELYDICNSLYTNVNDLNIRAKEIRVTLEEKSVRELVEEAEAFGSAPRWNKSFWSPMRGRWSSGMKSL